MAGRPTTYEPKYCDAIIECLAEGHSVTGFAGSIGVGRKTIFDWLEKHEDFAAAYEIAKAKSVFHWEKEFKTFAKSGNGSAAAFIFALKNRASDDWSDVQKHQHAGAGDGPIKVTISGADAGLL